MTELRPSRPNGGIAGVWLCPDERHHPLHSDSIVGSDEGAGLLDATLARQDESSSHGVALDRDDQREEAPVPCFCRHSFAAVTGRPTA